MRKKIFGMVAVMALAGALAVGCGNKDTKETETSGTTEKVEEVGGEDETKADESDAETEQKDTESETNAE